MQTNLNLEQFIPNTFLQNIYQGGQKIKAALSLAHKNFSTEIRRTLFPTNIVFDKISSEASKELEKRFNNLINQDWKDAQQGIYPVSLLFDDNLLEFLPSYLSIWLDYPATWSRLQKQKSQDLPQDINLEKYPQYYLRNFHFQSDGYLSNDSANIYDLQVDILFNGTADAMRRRILKPLKEALSKLKLSSEAKILDVACGTGRTLKFIRSSLATASLYGIDLSSAYLRKANQLLSQMPEELPQLIEANAENLPYPDDYFQGLSNVFLLHELPNSVRQKVINEFYRVLQPGGVLVIADSMQLSDSPELESLMNNFPRMFHEPFYRDYIKDDIALRLDKAGFADIREEVHGFSKYWIATKA
jgi:ubiquinone/menaquinone biosynthesis C-methylase UbiE